MGVEPSAVEFGAGRSPRPGSWVRRRALRLVAALVAVLLLAACGARIDTTMEIQSDGSGSRVMVLTLSAEDSENLTGSVAEVDGSIRQRLPDEIAFSGVRSDSDGGHEATFSITFESPEEYERKARALLEAGGVTSPNIEFSITDSLLKSGIVLEEGFTSYQLLKWMFDGLLEDGIVAPDNASNMYEIGDTVLIYGGESSTHSSSYRHTDVVDNGFVQVAMLTDIVGDQITRTLEYSADPDALLASRGLYEQYFDIATPAGAELDEVSPGIWRMTFIGDAERIADHTDTALQSVGTVFSVDSRPASDDPAKIVTTVTDIADCSEVCSGSAGYLFETLSAGPGYTPQSIDVVLDSGEPVTFENAPPFESVQAVFEVGLLGAVSATVEFLVANEHVALVGDGFAELLRPAEGIGELRTQTGDTTTTFTAVIEGRDAESFSSAYESWAPGSFFAVEETEDSGVFGRELRYWVEPGLAALTRDHPVAGDASVTLSLPFGHRATSPAETLGPGAELDTGLLGSTVRTPGTDRTVTLTASAPTIPGVVLMVLFLAALVAVVVLLVIRRRWVLATLRAGYRRLAETIAQGENPSLLELPSPSASAPVRASGGLLDLPQQPPVPFASGSLLERSAAPMPADVSRATSVLDLRPASVAGLPPSSMLTWSADQAPSPTRTALLDLDTR